MGVTQFLAEHIMQFYETTGYVSVFIFMTLESMIFPVPSEAVLPPAGLLIAQGRFTFAGVIIASTLGSIVGSLLSYWIGVYGGRPFIERFGKYFLLDKKALQVGEKYFNKHGDWTIFVCRFIPVVRHLISIPAGFGRMNIWKFSLYTIIGAGMWNAFLTWAGVRWGQQGWDLMMKYGHTMDIIIIVLIVLAGAYFFWKHFRNRNKSQAT
ncbi:MAG: DedA family protein [Bacteroidales bacterium]|nr:DedA family protein [Bacteroidales bacterium]